MPTYTFKDKKTGKEWTEFMSISEMEEFLKTGTATQVFNGSYPILDSWRMGVTKNEQGWKDVLRNVKSKFPGSTIDV